MKKQMFQLTLTCLLCLNMIAVSQEHKVSAPNELLRLGKLAKKHKSTHTTYKVQSIYSGRKTQKDPYSSEIWYNGLSEEYCYKVVPAE